MSANEPYRDDSSHWTVEITEDNPDLVCVTCTEFEEPDPDDPNDTGGATSYSYYLLPDQAEQFADAIKAHAQMIRDST